MTARLLKDETVFDDRDRVFDIQVTDADDFEILKGKDGGILLYVDLRFIDAKFRFDNVMVVDALIERLKHAREDIWG